MEKFSEYVMIRMRMITKGRCQMKRKFVKEFQAAEACDVYIAAVKPGEKNVADCPAAGALLGAVEEAQFSGKEGELFSAQVIEQGRLVRFVFAGLGETATEKSVETAFRFGRAF